MTEQLWTSLGSAGKEAACNVGDLGSIPGLGRSPGEGKGYPLQYSGLENSRDSTVHAVAKSWTRLKDFRMYWVSAMQLHYCNSCTLVVSSGGKLTPSKALVLKSLVKKR